MTQSEDLGWQALPDAARAYVATVTAVGACVLVALFPRSIDDPALFTLLLLASSLTSLWKVNLPIPRISSSTLSMSYAADLMALLLLGPRPAVVIAVVGVWTQCTFKVKAHYPFYRTAFSMGAEAITMAATGAVYVWLGGPLRPVDAAELSRALVGAIATYFFVNTGLVAAAIALSTGRRVADVWRTEFLWSAASFMVAATAGAVAAVIIARGEHWKALLMVAPVYLTYRSYQLFVGRIEDQKQHQRALAEARDRAEHASQLKDQFMAMVSHELRTPLNAILGWADMLRHGRLADPQRERACKAIYDSARRQAQLIDELLDVARIMSGKLRVERSLVDLNDVARGALEIVQPTADAKHVRIVVEADPNIGAIIGDAARLQQIAWNLLSNSVKFTPAGGTVRFRAHRVEDEHVIEVTVTDNGEGIPREFLPSVFEPFRQADGSTTRPHGGLGLGLSIVKHLVEAHGGTVRADSDGPGCGATFTVRLPLAAPADMASMEMTRRSATGLRESAARASLHGMAVLVVDDDEQSREVVAAHLEHSGAKVLTAESAAQAFELLQRERVDVLLADVAMPGEDGYTLLRRVRTLNGSATASIPAVALTAFAREEDKQQALRAGFQLHLPKPVDPRALLAAVASLSRVPAT